MTRVSAVLLVAAGTLVAPTLATVRAARMRLGNLKSRKLKSATFVRKMPGAPDGEYVVLEFESSFESKVSAVETMTPTRRRRINSAIGWNDARRHAQAARGHTAGH